MLSALTLEPAPHLPTVLLSTLKEKKQLGDLEWASAVARVNLLLRRRGQLEQPACQRLLDEQKTPSPFELIAASRVLLEPWKKTTRPPQPWSHWPDCQSPSTSDLSQSTRQRFVEIFLGLLRKPLKAPFTPVERGCSSWTQRFMATAVVLSFLIERRILSLEGLAALFTPSLKLTPEIAESLVQHLSYYAAPARAYRQLVVGEAMSHRQPGQLTQWDPARLLRACSTWLQPHLN